jgi:cellulose synthase/poly-beta-1,6-N-acetylglucosamine synthase-like glycosyltransferase
LLSIHLKITLLLLLLTLYDLGCAVFAQQAVFGQDSFENTSGETGNRLDTIIELLEQSRQGSIIQLNLTIIVFMMGLAFVIFGLYIGQEHKLSVFTKRLYLIAYFALIVPITVILLRYIASALLSGTLNDPVLNVAFLLLIPVTASYVLMVVKSRHDVVGRRF